MIKKYKLAIFGMVSFCFAMMVALFRVIIIESQGIEIGNGPESFPLSRLMSFFFAATLIRMFIFLYAYDSLMQSSSFKQKSKVGKGWRLLILNVALIFILSLLFKWVADVMFSRPGGGTPLRGGVIIRSISQNFLAHLLLFLMALFQKSEDIHVENWLLKEETRLSQLSALKALINPHFLYNT